MSVSVGDFVGSWQINFATGPLTQPGKALEGFSTILIGTGRQGDTPPSLNGDYQVVVGFALLDAAGQPLFTSADVGHQASELMLVGNQLRWAGYYGNEPLYIFISVAELDLPGDERGTALYGTTIHGDPDQVGVWGGSGMPTGGAVGGSGGGAG